jgi:hypothetical protein
MDLFRPYLGGSNGSADRRDAARRRDEEGTERLYEEAVGERPVVDEPL